MYDIIVIGAGISGLTAAIYAGSRGKNTLVLEKNKAGGVLGGVSTVTHYPGVIEEESGKSIISRILNQVEAYKIPIVKEEVETIDFDGDIKIVKTKENTYKTKVIIMANGTSPKKLDADLKDFTGGIYYNAIDHIDEYKDQEIFVIGGSDGAVKEAIFLSDLAKKVYIIHHGESLGTINEFKEKLAEKNNIDVLLKKSITKIKGNKDNFTITLVDENSKEIEQISSSKGGIFVYIGSRPNTENFNFLQVENGYIKTDDNMETNIEGIFAAGDIRAKNIRQGATAASDGVIAGVNAISKK